MKTFDELIEAEAFKIECEDGQRLKKVEGFKAGAKFVASSPTMIESVRELVDALEQHHNSWADYSDIKKCGMECALTCRHLKEFKLALKKLEKDL